MKNVRFDHAISFHMLRKVFSYIFSKTMLGLSVKLEMGNLSVHIFRGPWLNGAGGRLFVLELNLAHALYCCYSEQLSWSSITKTFVR